jgi:replication factor C large subunit
MPELWTEKHAPKNWAEFIGNPNVVARIRQWAEAWQQGKKQKPILLYGPVGNGKTTLALLCARMMGWQVFEMNASDFRTRDIIERLAGAASQGASFSGSLRLILLDEVDGLQAQDRGGAEAIAKILRETRNPVILTANDIYANRKLVSIRAHCELLEMKRVHVVQIAKLLQRICIAENVPFEKEAIALLAKRASGDVRAAILDLQTLATRGKITVKAVDELSYREREENIFMIVATIMRAKSFAQVRSARARADVDNELLNAWISENIPRQFDASDTASAFNYISKADVFEGRIMKRQYYGLRRYSYDLATACAVLSRRKEYAGWVKYQFPRIIKELSASMQQRAIRQSICKKIGKLINESARSVSQYELPLVKLLFSDEKAAAALTAVFDFDEKEIAFLLGREKSEKEIDKIKALAEDMRRQYISTRMAEIKKARSKRAQSEL